MKGKAAGRDNCPLYKPKLPVIIVANLACTAPQPSSYNYPNRTHPTASFGVSQVSTYIHTSIHGDKATTRVQHANAC
jgi:hypothetical protein